VVGPGLTPTRAVNDIPRGMIDTIIAQIPMQRIAQPEDIADAILFFARRPERFRDRQAVLVYRQKREDEAADAIAKLDAPLPFWRTARIGRGRKRHREHTDGPEAPTGRTGCPQERRPRSEAAGVPLGRTLKHHDHNPARENDNRPGQRDIEHPAPVGLHNVSHLRLGASNR
jgi:hypothetical protein